MSKSIRITSYLTIVTYLHVITDFDIKVRPRITVDVKKFTGLNFCGFNLTEVFVEILSVPLARSAYYLREVLIPVFMEKLSRCSLKWQKS